MMKKILVVNIVFITMIVFCITTVSAEKVDGLTEKLDQLVMERQFSAEIFSQMDEEYLKEYDDWFWNEYLPPTKRLGKMNTNSDEEEYVYCLDRNRPDYSYGILMTHLNTSKYAKQYAENTVFDYLLDDTKQYWAVLHKRGHGVAAEFRKDGSRIYNMDEEMGERYEPITITQDMIDYLKNPAQIENMLLEKGENVVTVLKLFSIQNGITLLYIKCNPNEYFIKMYGFTGYCDYIPEIIEKKLYETNEVLDSLSVQSGRDLPSRFQLAQNVVQTKPTFSAEATALQSEGLLKGNENGLDLLKPLTRMEATAMLLRAIGESETADDNAQVFSDVPNNHWGFGAAKNAYELGLVKGVGDDTFAPDDSVTAVQFATMVLRAANTGDFDWEQAVNILIEKGIINQENAATMDFFTRGDMAKMIYEARAKGLL